MTFYRVAVTGKLSDSNGFEWYTSKRLALVAAAGLNLSANVVEPVDVIPTKQGILDALRKFAGHPDNG